VKPQGKTRGEKKAISRLQEGGKENRVEGVLQKKKNTSGIREENRKQERKKKGKLRGEGKAGVGLGLFVWGQSRVNPFPKKEKLTTDKRRVY